MSNFNKDIEELVTCPYNSSHDIRLSDLPGHLLKCKRQIPGRGKKVFKKMSDNVSPQEFRGEELVTCPFNDAHRIRKNRLQFHLSRCKRTQNNTGMVTCTLNSTHVVSPCELATHMATCQDRRVLETFKYTLGGTEKKGAEALPVQNFSYIQPDESWGEDNHATYNPLEKIQSDHTLLVGLHGAIPSERKRFRQERKHLFNSFQEDIKPFARSGWYDTSSTTSNTGAKSYKKGMSDTSTSTSNNSVKKYEESARQTGYRQVSRRPTKDELQSPKHEQDIEEFGVEPFNTSNQRAFQPNFHLSGIGRGSRINKRFTK